MSFPTDDCCTYADYQVGCWLTNPLWHKWLQILRIIYKYYSVYCSNPNQCDTNVLMEQPKISWDVYWCAFAVLGRVQHCIQCKKRKHPDCDLNLLARFLVHYLCRMMFTTPPLILQLVFQTQFKILELTFKNLNDHKFLRGNITCHDLWLFKSAEEALLKMPPLSNSCLFSI